MADETSEQISTRRLKSFVKHLCIISKKHKDREEARAELQRQMEKLKRFTSKKREMDEELEELNRKVALVLEKEAQLLGIKQIENTASRELMNRVVENRENIRQLNSTVNELRNMLQYYMNIKTDREKRIKELEERIESKTQKKRDVALLKAKLKRLEESYKKMKKRGANIEAIESKIKALKARLI